MKIKILLTFILLISTLWFTYYFAKKKQHDNKVQIELKEKRKNNYDSIFLSDIVYLKNEKLITSKDSLPKSTLKKDNLLLIEINMYDQISWMIKLPKENILFQSYQNENNYVSKFKKSTIHITENPIAIRAGKSWDRFIEIYNKDLNSEINKIRVYFYHGQLQKLIIFYQKLVI